MDRMDYLLVFWVGVVTVFNWVENTDQAEHLKQLRAAVERLEQRQEQTALENNQQWVALDDATAPLEPPVL